MATTACSAARHDNTLTRTARQKPLPFRTARETDTHRLIAPFPRPPTQAPQAPLGTARPNLGSHRIPTATLLFLFHHRRAPHRITPSGSAIALFDKCLVTACNFMPSAGAPLVSDFLRTVASSSSVDSRLYPPRPSCATWAIGLACGLGLSRCGQSPSRPRPNASGHRCPGM